MLVRYPLKFLIPVATLLLAGCGGDKPASSVPTKPAAEAQTTTLDTLVATLQPSSGSNVSGVVVLTREGDQLILGAAIDGVAAGEHGIHVHENGDCSAPDGSSAGGHFDPDSSPHGAPTADQAARHAGDFGNFTADNFEQGKFSITKQSDAALEIFDGRAIIVHAKPDDLVSQPSGAAGARIACGVLKPLQR